MTGEGKAFSFSNISDFDAHIAREIRGYDILREQVINLADAFIADGSTVYDIGCSTGKLINNIATRLAAEKDPCRRRQAQLIGIEPNRHFTDSFRPANAMVQIRPEAIDETSTFKGASLVLSLFSLQFMPVHGRAQIVRAIYNGLQPRGAFIWAEKVHACSGIIESLLDSQHIRFKRDGSAPTDILDKAERLHSVMRPLTAGENVAMLQAAGFQTFETFWRVNNFMAVVAIKTAAP